MLPVIIIHGGFFSESISNADIKAAKQNALRDIVIKSYEFLKDHSALETVVFATALLENADLFNAGTGSHFQRDGKIRMSASLMDGASGKFSGTINISDIKNPIRFAEKLLNYEDRVLAGKEALNFARELGFKKYNPEIPQRRREYEEKVKLLNPPPLLHRKKEKSTGTGTVGCVALDKNSNLAAATSTGGKGFEIPGRVSDSATVAGNYANEFCGVSCTGIGEDIINAALASKIVTRVTDGFSLKDAVEKSFLELKKSEGFAGVICLDAKGNFYHLDSHPYMVWALCDEQKTEVFK